MFGLSSQLHISTTFPQTRGPHHWHYPLLRLLLPASLRLYLSIFSHPSTHNHSPEPSTTTNPPPLTQPLATINHYKPIHHHKPSNHQQNPFINHWQNQNPFIKIKIKTINRTHQPLTKPIHQPSTKSKPIHQNKNKTQHQRQNQNPAPAIMVLVFQGSRFDGGGRTGLNQHRRW